MRCRNGREHEQAPDAVDDAGNAGQQLDRDADRPAQPHRAQLGEEERDHEPDRHRDQHGDERGDERAVDRREGAELLGHRIPAFLGAEKPKPKVLSAGTEPMISARMTPLRSTSTRSAAARVRWRNVASLRRSRSRILRARARRPKLRSCRLTTRGRPPVSSRARASSALSVRPPAMGGPLNWRQRIAHGGAADLLDKSRSDSAHRTNGRSPSEGAERRLLRDCGRTSVGDANSGLPPASLMSFAHIFSMSVDDRWPASGRSRGPPPSCRPWHRPRRRTSAPRRRPPDPAAACGSG